VIECKIPRELREGDRETAMRKAEKMKAEALGPY
jgi:hypothetical protein